MKMPENKGGGFAISPSGTHLAVCVKLVDLGTQTTEFKGENFLLVEKAIRSR